MEVDSLIRLHHIATDTTLPEKLRVRLVDDELIQLQMSTSCCRGPPPEPRLFTASLQPPDKAV